MFSMSESLQYLLWRRLAGQQGVKKLIHVLQRRRKMCQLQPLMVIKYICAGKPLWNLTSCESRPDVTYNKTSVCAGAAYWGEEFVGEVGVFCQDVGCQVKVLRGRERETDWLQP